MLAGIRKYYWILSSSLHHKRNEVIVMFITDKHLNPFIQL